MRLLLTATLLLLTCAPAHEAHAYSVLSHEQLIDVAWDSDIKPLLLKRYPSTTENELQLAHAYAYGGSAVQDLGYYPFGSHEFTNLLHYVRSGDFVTNILREASNLNEYAFALGALSHYVADCWGHPAVNEGVGIEYPKLREKYGAAVTYEDNPEAHLQTEFSFDVLQVAKKRYISKQYHDFIGFEVAQELIERAFLDTYGIDAAKFLHFGDLAIGSYRFGISHVIPEMTQVAVALQKNQVRNEKQDQARSEFLYHISRADYERDFGATYHKPGVFARILAFLFKLLPKFGPFKPLKYRDPTPQTEDMYFRSMDNVIAHYHRLVKQVEAGDLHIPNRNLDTGAATEPGQYKLADETYSDLARRLEKNEFVYVTPSLKAQLLEYFSNGAARESMHRHRWHETEKALTELKQAKTVTVSNKGD